MAKQCYGIHFIDTHEDVIVHNWLECQTIRKGRPNLMKGFESDKDAEKWLSSITLKQEEDHLQMMDFINRKKAEEVDKKQYTFQLELETASALDNKLAQMRVSVDKLVNDLIYEYLYGDE